MFEKGGMNQLRLVLLLLFMLSACSQQSIKGLTVSTTTKGVLFNREREEQEIFTLIINANLGSTRPHIAVIEPVYSLYATELVESCSIPNDPTPFDTDISIIEDFRVSNQTPISIATDLKIETSYELMSSAEYDTFFSGNDIEENWRNFWNTYPDGTWILSMSRIGFNAERSDALGFISLDTAPYSGGFVLYHLQKVEREWKIVDTPCIAES